jgi:hypothetical protein
MSFIEINTRSKNIYRGDPKLSANLPIVQNLQKKKVPLVYHNHSMAPAL